MKRITLALLLISIFTFTVEASPSNHGVEIRIKLIQQANGSSGNNIAVSISIINHSDQDIYIPGFDAGPYESGIELYEKNGSKFTEASIDLLGQIVSKPGTGAGTEMFIYHEMKISKQFEESTAREKKIQDSVLELFGRKNHILVKDWKQLGNRPMFLKAHEELLDFQVYDLDFLFEKASEYKICFEPQKTAPFYSPNSILGYKRYDQSLIESNAIYYTTIPISRTN